MNNHKENKANLDGLEGQSTDFDNDSEQNEVISSYSKDSQWKLMGIKFKKHKTAIVGLWILIILYFIALFCDYLSPYDPNERFVSYMQAPPMKIHFIDEDGKLSLKPFVYEYKMEIDSESYKRTYTENKDTKYYITLFTRGSTHKILGILKTDFRLFGVEEPGVIFLFGTDDLGRDMFSRVLHGTRISLFVGLIGVTLSFVLGCILGGISGYFGGVVDLVIQRIIEFLLSLPTIPLWMSLSVALPKHWSPLRIYFFITLILSIFGWCGLARVVRGKIISIRDEDFVMAAVSSGATDFQIIRRHMLPSFMSYLIVNITIAIPGMIIGETALSFLGLGLRPPVVSWGVLLRSAQDIRVIASMPWLLIPSIFVVVSVLAFNLVGDGLRDAADPYKEF